MSEEPRAELDVDALPPGQALAFEIAGRCGATAARAGIVRTPHGALHTPVFMPVGTHATVKAVGPDDLEAIGASIVLANTYHLLLRPGRSWWRASAGCMASCAGRGRF